MIVQPVVEPMEHCTALVLHVSVQLVHGADVELELVHGGDEERHDLRDDLARVPLVVLDRDRPVLLYTLQRCRGVQSAIAIIM